MSKFGFISEGRVFLVRCPVCGAENYSANVSSGVCTWCGYQPTVEQFEKDLKFHKEERLKP